MFIKYIITITKIDNSDSFVCQETPIATYSAKFNFCSCGKFYPEPTVLNNGDIVIYLLVSGTPKVVDNKVIYIGPVNTDLITLADIIKPFGTVENNIIRHSINCALEHISTEYGRDYDYCSCPGQS